MNAIHERPDLSDGVCAECGAREDDCGCTWQRLAAELLGRLDAHASLSAQESASLHAARASLPAEQRVRFDAARSAAWLAERAVQS